MGYNGAQGGPQGIAGAQMGQRFGGPQAIQGGPQAMPGGPGSNSKQALQNMLRARHPSPGGQYVAPGAPQQVSIGGPGQYGGPTPQYGPSMGMPSGQPSMGGMTRPMYPGGQGMGSMGPGYGGMPAASSYGAGY